MVKRLILTVGVSGSGKSTFAEELTETEGFVEINRDTIRFTQIVDNGGVKDWTKYKFTKAREDLVTAIQVEQFETAAREGKPIVVSDTNLNEKYINFWTKHAEKAGYTVELEYFDVTWKDAVARAANRPGGVDYSVLNRQFLAYWKMRGGFKAPEHKGNKPKAVIIDVDGTVASMNGRSPYDWDRVGEDNPRTEVIVMVRALIANGHYPIFLSGRSGVCYEATYQWILQNVMLNDNNFTLLMREPGSMRPDTEVKLEIYRDIVAPEWDVTIAIDDRPCIVRLWYTLGIKNVISVANPYHEF